MWARVDCREEKMMDKLKPCPFCGSDKINISGFEIFIERRVICEKCNCCTDFYDIAEDETEDELHERISKIWNTRYQDPSRISVDKERLEREYKILISKHVKSGTRSSFEKWLDYLQKKEE